MITLQEWLDLGLARHHFGRRYEHERIAVILMPPDTWAVCGTVPNLMPFYLGLYETQAEAEAVLLTLRLST